MLRAIYSVVKGVTYSKTALRILSRMPTAEARRVVSKIEASDLRSQGNKLTALVGRRPYIRLRVGDWGVTMSDRGAALDVVEIGSRWDTNR